MSCQDALDRMLEAEPATLRGDAGGDPLLAAHLRSCPRCRGVASALAGELAALDAGLGRLAAGGGGRRGRPAGGALRPLPLRAWATLATAAALATVLLVGRGGGPAAGPGGSPEAGVPLSPDGDRVAVTLPADRGSAVLSTTNPNITVVWFYERSER